MSRCSGKSARFVFVTGGVVSSVGKGIFSASLGALLKARGLRVLLRKLDPYINVDSGTIRPGQHGEVFVTNDGAETDLDLGHYERFSGIDTNRDSVITTGRVYMNVISKERRGDYLGQTIQVIPHITDEIKEHIAKGSDDVDVVICEIGGTVGDIEGLPFLEAIRQIRNEVGEDRCLFIHLAWIVYLENLKELKTKPAQHSVKELQRAGIQPDILVCRGDMPLTRDIKEKLSLFCNVSPDDVIEGKNASNIYEIPLTYHAVGLDSRVCGHFGNCSSDADLGEWENIANNIRESMDNVTIGVVGKYSGMDSYRSVFEALSHSGIFKKRKVLVEFFDGEKFDSDNTAAEMLSSVDAILVPGGFGKRAVDGKLRAIKFARENKVPFLGICLGLQLAVIEALRNISGVSDANSSEFDESCKNLAVARIEEWMSDDKMKKCMERLNMGGTMRLGAFSCAIKEGSLANRAYNSCLISERHRHRYEVNNNYRKKLEEAGVVFSGLSVDGELVEIIEREDHPWFLAVQFHPEFKSRPFAAHPLFISFVDAACEFCACKVGAKNYAEVLNCVRTR
ncbi:CTP synthase [Candidatus Hydrogenosomobacter endosymbioticus]|uniref:CTP synthase n=1 Tax=Candidatus Hydrogenosomobacter endosymbioticus TaxID=2558174 RepID=A0ABM7V9H9_9PROT|nr:CTP synthase [Candidatus Hydrogenosomobacter endosymbioticus]BDB96446.1 CTP synthase [Candidatus Hydrogenosomobacter endosymbioticus]